jgi:hypothetical protein
MKMMCRDPFLNYLKEYGYNVVRLPKADVRPLQMLSRQGRDLDRLGDLTTVLAPGEHVALPDISENTTAANISGRRTSDLSFGIGLSVLGNIIGAMGGSKLGLDVRYRQASSIAFEFHDVLEDKVEVAALDRFLADADVDPFSRHVADLLEADQIYVTTSTIKSNKFTVQARKSDGTELSLEVPVVQQLVGANVKVSGDEETASNLTYEGKMSLVFGFQAWRLFYYEGRYHTSEYAGDLGSMRGPDQVAADGARRLVTESPFVRFGDL